MAYFQAFVIVQYIGYKMRQHTIVHIVLIIMIVILHSYNILNKNSTSHTQTHTFSSRIVRIFPINRGDHIYYVKPFHQNEPKDARRLKCIRMKAHRKKMPQATFKRMRLSSLCVLSLLLFLVRYYFSSCFSFSPQLVSRPGFCFCV